MHHHITAINHQGRFASAACPWLAVDGVPIEVWLATHLGQPDLELHALSLVWLSDDGEDALANRRIMPAEDGTSTLVPLLVCSSDMDFDCAVLMAEQVVDGDTLQWRRFGLSVSGGLEVGACTRWNTHVEPVSFALDDFKHALAEHKRLLDERIGAS
ncbi:hypothetical protein [Stenotrophomonas maltophilia]|uniref:hypothetical protein n=1 Tax=Stenotrophomonas maltophilia TaxID=40324 RepID=UPI0034DAE5C5